MRVAITGARGLLGTALTREFSAGHEVFPLDRQSLDVTDQEEMRRRMVWLRPDWVLHTAAFTSVDEAESNAREAHRVNVLGSRNAAAAALDVGSRLLYFSTDYVFDGCHNSPYREWDPPAPLSEYGRSKLAGEWLVRSLLPGHLIVRTSWLYGPGGVNFVEKIARRARRGDPLRVVNDQRGSPTYTADLAAAARALVESERRGTYHVTNSGDCTWFEFALEIVTRLGIQASVAPIESARFGAPAPRPAYSVLDNCLYQLDGFSVLRPWIHALAEYLEEPGL